MNNQIDSVKTFRLYIECQPSRHKILRKALTKAVKKACRKSGEGYFFWPLKAKRWLVVDLTSEDVAIDLADKWGYKAKERLCLFCYTLEKETLYFWEFGSVRLRRALTYSIGCWWIVRGEELPWEKHCFSTDKIQEPFGPLAMREFEGLVKGSEFPRWNPQWSCIPELAGLPLPGNMSDGDFLDFEQWTADNYKEEEEDSIEVNAVHVTSISNEVFRQIKEATFDGAFWGLFAFLLGILFWEFLFSFVIPKWL